VQDLSPVWIDALLKAAWQFEATTITRTYRVNPKLP